MRKIVMPKVKIVYEKNRNELKVVVKILQCIERVLDKLDKSLVRKIRNTHFKWHTIESNLWFALFTHIHSAFRRLSMRYYHYYGILNRTIQIWFFVLFVSNKFLQICFVSLYKMNEISVLKMPKAYINQLFLIFHFLFLLFSPFLCSLLLFFFSSSCTCANFIYLVHVCVLDIYRVMLSDKKYGLSANIIATRVMPSLLPHSVNPSFSIEQFGIVCETLQEMLDHIDRSQRNKLKLDNLSIPSPERHRTLRHQFSSDNMNVQPFNIPNLRIDQRKTSSAEDMARKNSTGTIYPLFTLFLSMFVFNGSVSCCYVFVTCSICI